MKLAHRFRRLLTLALLVLLTGEPARAQLPDFSDLTESARKVLGHGSTTGKLASADVRFNSRDLFRVYAPRQQRAQERADLVNLRLAGVERTLTQRRKIPEVEVRRVDLAVVVFLDKEPLLTVTEADTTALGNMPHQVANAWAAALGTALDEALQERKPEFYQQAATGAGLAILAGLLLNVIIWYVATWFLARPGWPVLVLVWSGVFYYSLGLFPQTRPVHSLLSAGVLRPLAIVVVVALAAAAVSRLLGIAVKLIFRPMPETLSPEERTERTFRRRATLGEVARVTGVSVVWFIAALVGLSWAGVNLPALLASAGLIGVALGLAAQDTMKDMVAGINILIDDRFGVGDVIRVGNYCGVVENLNLRVTQIRDSYGALITFSNRQIETVANLTSRWSQVDFKVGVAYESDLRAALRVMEETAQRLAKEWPDQILGPPEVLGTDSYNDSDITLRMTLRTAPGDQWTVARELRLRIKEAFDAAGIVIPYPQRTVNVVDRGSESRMSPFRELAELRHIE